MALGCFASFIYPMYNTKLMIVKRFQNRVAESRVSLPLAGVYAFVVCVLNGLFAERLFLQFSLLAVSSFLMMELNNANALIRIYSRMVSCSFLVLAVMSRFLFVDTMCCVVQMCFIAFYLILFSVYQEKSAVGSIFYSFAMIGIASTVFVQILFFVPVIWILLCTNIMAGSIRGFVASLLGLLVPYCFWATYGLYTGNVADVAEHLTGIAAFGGMERWLAVPLPQLLCNVFVVVLAVVGMIHFRLNNYKDKIRTRMLFEIFSVMSILTIVFLVLQPQHMHFLLAILIVSASPMVGHFIALTNTFLTNIAFYVIVVVSILLTALNIWMPC